MLRASRVLTVVAMGVATMALLIEPASACGRRCPPGGGDGNTSTPNTGDGGLTITISGSGVNGGSGGSFTVPAEDVVVLPPCRYFQGFTGKEYYEFVEEHSTFYDPETHEPIPPYAGYKQHKNDTEGHWWAGMCSSGDFDGELGEFFDHAEQWFESEYDGPVYVEAGEQPPVPPIPPEVLMYYAREHMDVPEPKIAWNPRIAEQGAATLVNLDTWVWLDDSPVELEVTAAAGGNSATVYAEVESMDVSAPTSTPAHCEGAGVKWSRTATGECAIQFLRSSGQEPDGKTDVTVQTNWRTHWSANGQPRGGLDPIQQTGVTQVPVTESQTLVTDVR